MSGTGPAIFMIIMQTNGTLTGNFVLLLGIACVVMLVSANDAGAHPTPLQPGINLAIGDQHDLGTQGTYDYLFTHYGGHGSGLAEAWYLNFNGIATAPGTSLSHSWASFPVPNGVVPDGGATMMLLGAALAALGVARRFLKA